MSHAARRNSPTATRTASRSPSSGIPAPTKSPSRSSTNSTTAASGSRLPATSPWTHSTTPTPTRSRRRPLRPPRADDFGGVTGMATLAPVAELRRGNRARVVALQPLLVPLASLLVASPCWGGPRLLLVVALPALAIGAISHRLSRPSAAGCCAPARSARPRRGSDRPQQPVDRRRSALSPRRHQPWLGRKPRPPPPARLDESPPGICWAVLVGFFVVFPTLLAVDFLAKPRASIDQAALGIAARARHLPRE